MHSRVHVRDEIGDLLVALTKCPNAPILIVVEIHGAIHVLIHVVISAPEVVPAHLDPLQALAVRQDRVRVAPLALEMTTAAVIHAVATAIGPRVEILVTGRVVTAARVVNMAIDPQEILVVAIVTEHLAAMAPMPVVILVIVPVEIVVRVVILVIVPVAIVVLVGNSAIDLLVILVVAIVIVHLVVMALMPVVILVIVPVAIVVLVVNMATDPVVTVGRVLIVDPVVSTETDQLVIVDRVVIMETVQFVAMTAVVILAVILVVVIGIVDRVVTMEIDPAVIVIVRPAVISVIVTALHVVTIQGLTHVVAIVIVLLVAMVQAQVVHLAHVEMTAVTVVVAVDRVAKTSHLVDQRTKLSVVVKPCVCAVAAKSAKTASRHRCHAKPRPGLMKAESKTTYAMLPKVLCVVGSHRAALCRRDQKMKTN